VIPTWRPPSETPIQPVPKLVLEVRAQVPGGSIRNSFAHFPHTFTNETGHLRIVDLEYYARFTLRDVSPPFSGLMYMAIFILAADQRPALPPIFSTLTGLVDALRNLGLGVAVAYISDSVVDIYTWSSRPLSAVRPSILDVVHSHMPTDATLNAVYYIVGENIMIWDEFNWDDGSVWADDPVRVYP